MGKSLVIVESPTKARTITAFLPKGFVVESSIGHIRDLPNSAKEIPANLKGEPWARLGINVDHDFEPIYVVPAEKKKQVAKLKTLVKDVSDLYLATDEDREGESISWHLLEVLNPKVIPKRLVFHEITREAIQAALKNPRAIDERLVEAQETRRKLDRLYGYEVSPVLWRKIAPRLSAGRVQSVAIRVIVEREERRRAFVKGAYWNLQGRFRTREGKHLDAVLVTLGGKRLASGKDFDPSTGQLRQGAEKDSILVTEAAARGLVESLGKAAWKASSVERKPYTKRPEPPFTTSTLQQEANRKLRLGSRDTMRAAQRLYENGFITYMRTDSTTLSDGAVVQTRKLIEDLYGKDYLSPSARQYQTKVKNAQEAHEAIRPAGDFRLPEDIRSDGGADGLRETELKVYQLIWQRTMACQMAEARGQNIAVQVSDGNAVFQANGKTIEFPGFLRAYVEGADDPEAELADKEKVLPDVSVNEPLACEGLEAKGHETKPPERYTEASLIKELESNGVGRPSTYASIIDTILRREYVVKQGNALVPTFVAFAVVGLLRKNFGELVDIQFTARMEDDLDEISRGERKSLPYLKSFYFGDKENRGLRRLIETDIDARESCTLPVGKDSEGRQVNVRIGRYGPYLERGEDRAGIPPDLAPDELTLKKAEELLAAGAAGPKSLGKDPASEKEVYLKTGRFGPYVQLGENGSDEKPKMKSLLPGMTVEDVTLEDALRVLALPRTLGTDPGTGEEVLADFGRFGPYVRCGKESRSIPKTEAVFDVTLERALELLKEEKKGGWRSRGPTVLKELGASPDTKETIKLLSGRYGPYVTDGTTNASLPRDADPEKITPEEAVSLLRARALAGPPAKSKFKKGAKSAKKSSAPRASRAAKEPSAPKEPSTAEAPSTPKKPGTPKAPGSPRSAKKSARKPSIPPSSRPRKKPAPSGGGGHGP
ncbi:MAG TPA: type I DNA topoisomerase [Planctomycetota bacterium]|nr:type I DNA topoisomerase [Planctomycetota bacterium]